jgi:hypothetical protein
MHGSSSNEHVIQVQVHWLIDFIGLQFQVVIQVQVIQFNGLSGLH